MKRFKLLLLSGLCLIGVVGCATPQIGDPSLTADKCRQQCGGLELGFGGIIFTSEKSKLCLCEGKKASSREAIKFLEDAIGILKGIKEAQKE